MEWGTRIGLSTYDVQKGTWNGTGVAGGPRTGFFGYTAATDPDTGLVYIPSGANAMTGMLVYDFVTKTISSALMPPPELLTMSVGKYAWAWNGLRQSMLLHGGANFANFSSPYGNPNLLEFIPSMAQWNRLTTRGQIPPALTEHCMVSALGGSKMVLYGGSLIDANNTLQGDVYILDVATLTWIKGPVPSSSQRRRNMACTVAGNNFVVWGGQSLNGEFMNMEVYDLQNNQWTTQFFLDSPPPNPMQTKPSDDSIKTRLDHGGTIGIIVGVTASVVFLIIVGCIWYCLRRRKERGGSHWSRVKNVNVNNKPKRASKRWRGSAVINLRNPREDNSLQHQIFEQERRSQEKSVSRSNSEKSVSEQLLSPSTTDNSDTIVVLSSGDVMETQEEWLRRQREEVNQERQALAIMQIQQLEYARQMEALKSEAFTQR
ncbi:hypothetical protein BGW39_011338 [Mortierella sp. 14UC]|nr:hypothetical protein BGW39_011338 [Mortierella sp. 14UC]